MKNSGMLSAVFISTAIALGLMSAINYLSSQYPLSAIGYGLIAVLAILDIVLLYILSTQEEVGAETIFCTLSFVGLSALIILYLASISSASTAMLSMGYSLVFLLGIAIFFEKEPQRMTVIRERPRMIIPRPDATLARTAEKISDKQDEEAFQRKMMQHRLERKVDRVLEGEEDAQEEMKQHIERKVEEIKREEKAGKQELARKVAEVKKEEKASKNELSKKVDEIKKEEKATKLSLEKKVDEIKKGEQETKKVIKKELEKVKKIVAKEPEFFVGSKTGTSLHRKDCIIVQNIPKKNRITFDSEKVAVKKGYKLCRVCFSNGKK